MDLSEDPQRPITLDSFDLLMGVVSVPLPLLVFADLMTAYADVAEKHGREASLFTDGSNRIVARKKGAPPRS